MTETIEVVPPPLGLRLVICDDCNVFTELDSEIEGECEQQAFGVIADHHHNTLIVKFCEITSVKGWQAFCDFWGVPDGA